MFRWKKSADPQAELRELIGAYELPSFSTAAVSTLGLLREDAELPLIAERLMSDPGLSVRILRTVNSAAFGLRQKATNLRYAVTLLGRSRVESLVLSAAVAEALPGGGHIDLGGFWRTAAQRACLARQIAASMDPPHQMEAFTAGLLQDMTVPVLCAPYPDRYVPLYRQAESDPASVLHEMEQGEFGYDHAQVGAMMAESWDLPEELITAIADHHLVGERSPDAVQAVSRVRHTEPPDDLESLRTHCVEELGIGHEELERMIESAATESHSLADSMAPGVTH